MEIRHVDGATEFKKGDIIPKGTKIGKVHFIPRVGSSILCIKVYDTGKNPVDYVKLIGMPVATKTEDERLAKMVR
jgi:hypothetical protein